MGRKIGSLILALALAASSVTGALAAASPAQGAYDRAAAFISKAVPAPEVSSSAGSGPSSAWPGEGPPARKTTMRII